MFFTIILNLTFIFSKLILQGIFQFQCPRLAAYFAFQFEGSCAVKSQETVHMHGQGVGLDSAGGEGQTECGSETQ